VNEVTWYFDKFNNYNSNIKFITGYLRNEIDYPKKKKKNVNPKIANYVQTFHIYLYNIGLID
jgi:hypothetical protein